MVSGSPALLSAQVLGSAQHLDWDLNGDGKTDVSCPADQPTLRFRPSLRAGAARAAAVGGSVSVKAVGPGGASPVLSQTFEVAPPQPTRSNRIKDAVVKLVAAQPTPYMCGLARDLVPAMTEIREDRKDGKDRPCLGGTLQAGALTLTGCFKAINRVADIPPAERGIVEGLASAIGVHTNGVKPDIPNTRQALGGFDGFVATRGALTINGAALTPGPQASLVVYTQANKIVSSDAALAVAGIALEKQPGPFTLNTTPNANGTIPVGSFVRASGPDDLGMLPMAGKLQLSLMPGAIGQPAAKISTNIKLPSFFNLGGNAPAYARVTLSVNADGKLALDELHIDLPKVKLGLMDVEKLRLDFTRAGGDSVWDGQARACLLAACVDASVTIRNGGFKQASANVTLPGEGLPLYPNVNLTQIGAGVSIDPTTFIGRVRVNAYKLYEINGRVALAFPSKEHPFQLTEAAFPGLTPDDYKHSFEVFTLAAAGDASLRFDPLNLTVPLGKAYFLYSWPGYVHVGGEIHQDFGPVTLTGRTSGEFNLKNGKFEFGQDMEACFLKWACRTATTRLSSRGVGACFSLEAFGGTPFETSVTVGGGVLFSPFKILPSIVGCRWSDFARSARLRRQVRRGAGQGGAGLRLVRSHDQEGRSESLHPPRRRRERTARAGHRAQRPGARQPRGRGAGADPRAAGAHLRRAQEHDRRALRAQARYVQDRPAAWVAGDHEGDGVRGSGAGARHRARQRPRDAAHAHLRRGAPSRPEGDLRRGRRGRQAPARHGHRRQGHADVLPRPRDGHAAHRGAVRTARHRRGDHDRRDVPAALPAPGPAFAGDGQSALGYLARRLHTRRRGGALRDRDHARDRWAAHHQHPSHRGHDHPRRPRQRGHGDRPGGRADAPGRRPDHPFPRHGAAREDAFRAPAVT